MTNEELAVKVRQGDQEAALQLWKQIQKLVNLRAFRCLPADRHTSRVELGDLMQAGYIAMISAANDFNSDSGFQFTTFLYYHLKSAFAKEFGIRSTRRDALLQAVSIDSPLSADSDEDYTLSDTLTDPGAEKAIESVLERMETDRVMSIITEQMKKLSDEQADMVRRFYLDGFTVAEIAAQSRKTEQQVKQIKERGILRLRHLPLIRKLKRDLFADSRTNFFLHVGVDSFQSGCGSAVERLTEQREAF